LTLGTNNTRIFTNVLSVASITATGNISANYFIGDGSLLTGISGNINVNANLLTGNTLSSNVIFSSLTTLGILSNVLTSGGISATGDIQAANISLTGFVSAGGNVTGNYILGNGSQLTGILTQTGNITFDNTTISTNILNANIIFSPTGTGVVAIAGNVGGATGIQLGPNTSGQFISNAVTLTTTTSVTNCDGSIQGQVIVNPLPQINGTIIFN
jgi:hypothetical protein